MSTKKILSTNTTGAPTLLAQPPRLISNVTHVGNGMNPKLLPVVSNKQIESIIVSSQRAYTIKSVSDQHPGGTGFDTLIRTKSGHCRY